MGAEVEHTPQRFGRYVLLDRMGVGGMAEVYRAVVPGAEGFRRDLVVKKILTGQAHAPNFIEMFVHEARISALLHHPNVVQVFDFGQVDGSYFLAMELLRGRDLLAVLRSLRERQRKLPIPIAVHIAHQVALGLGYAHALTSPDGQPLHIVHRDVSPSNIMCMRAGGVKLVDFGIAQAIGEMESGQAEGGGFKGKLGYMAPERLRNEAQDGRVDLFALGAVLWEMLAGRRLFPGKTDEEKLKNLLETPIVAPSTIRDDVPAALDEIVMKALERDRDKRYLTGQALADDLEVVAAETKYHSRMLPALLAELFGSAPSAAHVTAAMLSPELFAVDCTPAVTPNGPTPVAGTVVVSPAALGSGVAPTAAAADLIERAAPATDEEVEVFGGVGARKRRVVLAALGVAVAVGLIVWAVARPHGGALAARAPTTVATPTTAPATSTLSPRSANPAVFPDPAATTDRAQVTAPPAGAGAAASSARPHLPHHRSAAKTARALGSGRITRGLSIDPFAEAAARGTAR